MGRLSLQLDTGIFDHPDIALPDVWTVRQAVEAPVLDDVEGAVQDAARTVLADPRIRPGASVAVGVGSRGINHLSRIVRTVIQETLRRGCEPFIVPAMGSHGGATAAGQEAVLREYGITPESVGAPIRATMDVQQVDALEDGYPVYFDCHALSADAVLLINRIKPHTDFSGRIESGIAKMCAIGLGKQKGASAIHRFGAEGLRSIMPRVARRLIERTNIVGGIAIIENPYGETAEVHPLAAAEIGLEKEERLLNRARQLSPRVPFPNLDVLVVDEMGKNISGSGMDTHVIGRLRMPSIDESEWDGPGVRIVCVLDLTEASHGNAAGIGLADMTTRRLMQKMDLAATMINHRTSGEGGILRSKLPLVLEDAEACVRAAIAGCGHGRPERVRLARIRNTEFVETLEISAPLLEEARARGDIHVLDGPHPLNVREPLAVGR